MTFDHDHFQKFLKQDKLDRMQEFKTSQQAMVVGTGSIKAGGHGLSSGGAQGVPSGTEKGATQGSCNPMASGTGPAPEESSPKRKR